MSRDDKRPEAYPKPDTEDKQHNNQAAEYIDQQPNDFSDKSVSDVAGTPANDQTNDPHVKRSGDRA